MNRAPPDIDAIAEISGIFYCEGGDTVAEMAYKFRLYPTKEQQIMFAKTFGCVRKVYNLCLDKRNAEHETNGTNFGYKKCSKLVSDLKKTEEYAWLKEVDSTALQKAVRYLDDAFQNYFEKVADHPVFKKKFNKQSYTSVNNNTKTGHDTIKVLDGCIQLPKVGKVECNIHRKVEGRILSATVSKTCSGEYFVSVCCTDVDVQPLAKTKQAVGIDMGQETYCTYNDGTKIENPHFYKQAERKKKIAQRSVSRKKKGSKNYAKAKKKLAKIEARTANRRSDFQHKLSKQIVTDYDVICIETLNAEEMEDHASDSKKQRHNNNKSLKDRAYGQFNRMLEYKAERYGKTLVKVDKYFPSSQLCHCCGQVNAAVKDLSVREWTCPHCGEHHDRDVNAAINILNEGLKLVS